jgi:hypothetical protein
MPRIGFADESGTDARSECYAIGVVSLPGESLADFNERIAGLKSIHGVVGEPKWTRVRTGHGLINFVLDCLHTIVTYPSFTFDVIVVNKRLYRNWQGDSRDLEAAFYKTYTYLLRYIVRRAKEMADVVIDARSDRYRKHDEAVQTIGNRMLAALAETGRLQSVTKADSADTPGIRVADVLTGAVNTAHLCRLCPRYSVHAGKRVAMDRLAKMLGWPHLAHDTYPHEKFNIWHFPTEFRGPSRDPIFADRVPYVCAGDIEAG